MGKYDNTFNNFKKKINNSKQNSDKTMFFENTIAFS